MTCDVGFFG